MGRYRWRARWFQIQNGYLKYFTIESEATKLEPVKAIDVRQIQNVQQSLKGFSFRVQSENGHHREFILKTLPQDRHRIAEWVAALSAVPSAVVATDEAAKTTYSPTHVYVDLPDKALTEVSQFQNDGSWTLLFTEENGPNNRVTSYRRPVNAEGLMEYLSFGEFPFPASKVFKVMQGDFDYLRKWEKNTLDVSVLDSRTLPCGDEYSLMHWVVKWPTFFKNREYLYMRRIREETKDGNHMFAVACQVPACLKNGGPLPASFHPTDAVRVVTYEALTVLSSTGPTSCKFVFKCIDDPQVVLPKSLLTWVVDQALPAYMKTMRNAIRDYDTAKNQ